MKTKVYKLALVTLFSISSMGISTIVKAESIPMKSGPQIQTRTRGSIGKYGKRPIIYKSGLTSKQWNCYVNMAGSMILSSPSGPYVMLGTGLLAWNNACR